MDIDELIEKIEIFNIDNFDVLYKIFIQNNITLYLFGFITIEKIDSLLIKICKKLDKVITINTRKILYYIKYRLEKLKVKLNYLNIFENKKCYLNITFFTLLNDFKQTHRNYILKKYNDILIYKDSLKIEFMDAPEKIIDNKNKLIKILKSKIIYRKEYDSLEKNKSNDDLSYIINKFYKSL